MNGKELPKGTVRINKGKILASPLFWTGCILVALSVGYLVLMLGYYGNKFPYWIDNAIHTSGVAFFKEKVYLPVEIEGWQGIIDPNCSSVVEETEMGLTYGGYIEEITKEDMIISKMVLSGMEKPLSIQGSWNVSRVLVETCLGEEGCEYMVYLPGTMDDVVKGSLVEIEFRKSWEDAGWNIAKIRVRQS